MKNKFVELRMFFIVMCILLFFLVYSIVLLLQYNIKGFIITNCFCFFYFIMVVTRNKIILYEEIMLIYEWKYIAMLPSVIHYKDIQSIEAKSKHHIIINHKRKSHCYVFNAPLFIETYKQIKK